MRCISHPLGLHICLWGLGSCCCAMRAPRKRSRRQPPNQQPTGVASTCAGTYTRRFGQVHLQQPCHRVLRHCRPTRCGSGSTSPAAMSWRDAPHVSDCMPRHLCHASPWTDVSVSCLSPCCTCRGMWDIVKLNAHFTGAMCRSIRHRENRRTCVTLHVVLLTYGRFYAVLTYYQSGLRHSLSQHLHYS